MDKFKAIRVPPEYENENVREQKSENLKLLMNNLTKNNTQEVLDQTPVESVDATSQSYQDRKKIIEILDRYEILFPDVEIIPDLRRSYVDKDLNSIFRLLGQQVDEKQNGLIEELRKAVVEKNLHSLFRLVGANMSKDAVNELRKAIVEKNLHSIFRIVDMYDTEELRKAVLEDNLYSIFKLIGAEDTDLRKAVTEENIRSIFRSSVTNENIENLRKLIADDNVWKMWPILDQYVDTQFTKALKHFYSLEIDYDTDCMSRGQLYSKLWLIEELKKINPYLGTVFLCAGWYATLATMLFESDLNKNITNIRSFDIDPSCAEIAEVFNFPWLLEDYKFKASTVDIMDFHFTQKKGAFYYKTLRNNGEECELHDKPDTIINTSCEHIENFTEWYAKIPDGRLVILQNNNFFEIAEHVNCVNSCGEFADIAPMTTLLYEGQLPLEKYTRYMRIGYK